MEATMICFKRNALGTAVVWGVIFAGALLTGCTGLLQSEAKISWMQAISRGFEHYDPSFPGLVLIRYAGLDNTTMHNARPSGSIRPHRLLIFIEGDGAAWRRRGTIAPEDPTPSRALGLELALSEQLINSDDTIVYLSRPCQYRMNSACDIELWTTGRYGIKAQELLTRVIQDLSDRVARSSGHSVEPSQMIFIGYSGGGTIAALISAKLQKGPGEPILCLITLASPLDTSLWQALQGFDKSMLSRSENPQDFQQKLDFVTSFYFFGESDTIVPPGVGDSLVSDARFLGKHQKEILQGVHHAEGWVERWLSIRRKTCLDAPG